MATTQFLPWLRRGLATTIAEPAVDGLVTTATSSAVVELAVTGSPVGGGADEVRAVAPHLVRLLGPGNITGIAAGEVLRTDPVDGLGDFEPNFFCLLELVSPDLPWRFTPGAPDASNRLQPWIALVVVEDREGVRLEARGPGAPVLVIDDVARELPPAADVWAWAHVQVEHDLGGGVEAALAEAATAFRSRLLCPRRLTEDRAWIACVVPTFEAGRLAGLGSVESGAPGPAWGSSGATELPVYHSWRFRSGPRGDFEALAERLHPVSLPPEVGQRDLGLSRPGAGLPPGGPVTYSGALISYRARSRPWPEEHRLATQDALRKAVNSSEAETPVGAGYDPLVDDPVVGPQAYGGRAIGLRRVPLADHEPRWFEELNTRPPYRAVAGLGAAVVRRDQERLMDAAWDTVREVAEANHRLASAAAVTKAAAILEGRLLAFDDATLVQFEAPAMSAILSVGGGPLVDPRRWRRRPLRPIARDLPDRTVEVETGLPSGITGAAFRRIGRTTARRALRRPVPSCAPSVTAKFLTDPTGLWGTYRDVVAPVGAEFDDPAGTSAGRIRARDGDRRRRLRVAQPTVPPTTPLPATVRAAIDAPAVIAAGVRSVVTVAGIGTVGALPSRLSVDPRFDRPLYERLCALSTEYLLPGIGLVPDESVGLLRTNGAFVEAFLVAANHELAREFRWREYPTALDGTWLRRFWNAAGGGDDIGAVSGWRRTASLGGSSQTSADLVVLVNGTLPRRYPEALVYLVEAQWSRIDGAWHRVERIGGDVQTPTLAGRIQPGSVFYGFDLDAETARGTTDPDEPAGYFVVFEEVPHAPRFGLDLGDATRTRDDKGTAPATWNELDWVHVTPAAAQQRATFVDLGAVDWLFAASARPTNGPDGARDRFGTDSATLARQTLQRPVRMLIHADSMLPELP
ncbi:hypothetical protein V6W11_25515 [Micromonospora profundi]|uniref:hypothetical protein n=1 Tax=Micromonospora profundi TaxID=1420889 RepID=UPI002FEF1290